MPKTRKIQAKIPQVSLEGRFASETVNVETRTVEMTFTTSLAVRMWNWDIGTFNEILSMKDGHVRLERMKKGAPLLDSHNRYGGIKAQIGVVEDVWTEGENLVGRVRFPKAEDDQEADKIFRKVKDGIIRNGSIGYRVHKYQDETKHDDKIKTLRGVDWEPYEMSLVSIPADPNAQVRADQNSDIECEITIENLNERTQQMPPGKETIEETKPNAIEADKIRQEEREKNAKIVRACRQMKLPDAFAEQLMSSGKSLEDCLTTIQEKWAESDGQRNISSAAKTNVDINGGLDETVTRREAIVESILHRAAPQEHKATEKSFKYIGRSALELCRMILEFNGVRTERMSQNDIIRRALSTSDFPNILADATNKRLQKGYESVVQNWRRFAAETTLRDFKISNVMHLGEAPALVKLGEGGSVKTGKVSDSKETYRLYTYASALPFTRETFINDDLNALMKLAASYGRSAAHMENTVAMKEAILDNPTMGDSVALFHLASHGNLQAASTVDEDSLSDMKAAMRKQKDDQSRVIGLSPKFLIVGPDQEVAAQKQLAATTSQGGFNVHAGAFELIVEPLIENDDHYVVADPSQVEGLEVAYLEGARGLQIETLTSVENLGMTVRAYEDFAAKVINYRAFQKTPGS